MKKFNFSKKFFIPLIASTYKFRHPQKSPNFRIKCSIQSNYRGRHFFACPLAQNAKHSKVDLNMTNKSLTYQPHLALHEMLDARYGFGVSLYNSRECSTNQLFLCKTNPIFTIFHTKTMIKPKNKPNSNPIQTQTKPILAQKSGGQSQFKPKQTQFQTTTFIYEALLQFHR